MNRQRRSGAVPGEPRWARLARAVLRALAAGVLLAGCGDDSSSPAVMRPALPTSTWQGTATVTASASGMARAAAVGDAGSALLDLQTASGDRMDGTLVMRWPGSANPIVAPLTGTVSLSGVHLATTTPDPSLTLELTSFGPTRLEGTLAGTTGGQALSASLRLDRIPFADLQEQILILLPQATVLAMAFLDDTLWLSTATDDFLLATRDGNVVDQVAVEYSPGTFWTSSVLAGGGGKLWGHLLEAQGPSSVSHVLPFQRAGREPGDFVLAHLSSGLTHDGTHLWSLDNEAQKLYRLTQAGALVDSIAVGNPDLYQLAWDGAHFWSMGWFLPLLWEIAPTGEVVGVYRLSLLTGSFAAGVAWDGQYLYVGRGPISGTTIARLSPATAVP